MFKTILVSSSANCSAYSVFFSFFHCCFVSIVRTIHLAPRPRCKVRAVASLELGKVTTNILVQENQTNTCSAVPLPPIPVRYNLTLQKTGLLRLAVGAGYVPHMFLLVTRLKIIHYFDRRKNQCWHLGVAGFYRLLADACKHDSENISRRPSSRWVIAKTTMANKNSR